MSVPSHAESKGLFEQVSYVRPAGFSTQTIQNGVAATLTTLYSVADFIPATHRPPADFFLKLQSKTLYVRKSQNTSPIDIRCPKSWLLCHTPKLKYQ